MHSIVSLLLIMLACLMAMPQALGAPPKRSMTVEDLFRFHRVADPQISPDGKWVAYTVTVVDFANNKTRSNIWLASTSDGSTVQLTNGTKADRHARWSPDSKQIVFESTRSGEGQLWIIPTGGGEARQLTTLATGATGGQWSPDGKTIAFVSAVYPEYSDKPFAESNALNKKRKEENEKSPVKAKVFTKLFFRHWDEYVEDKRQHLFAVVALGGEPRDLTPGDRDTYPTSSTFETGDNFTFSPDGSHLVFTAVPSKDEAWSTNYDICRVPIAGGAIECLTSSNHAADSGPRFSPSGKHLVYRSQKRAGFEADRWELMLAEADATGKLLSGARSLTPDFDTSVGDYAWKGDNALLVTADIEATTALFALPLDGKVRLQTGKLALERGASRVSDAGKCSYGPPSSDRAGTIWTSTRASMSAPNDVLIWKQAGTGSIASALQVIPEANKVLLAELDLPRPESVKVAGAGGTPMQMWILKPPGFDANKKWPLVYLVHGGPQGAWEDTWSFRWNPEVWAAQGYVVAMPNPRGSTGFGQKYVDEISGDWGGKCYEDLMAGLSYMEKQSYIDPQRMASAGASFGGYMMNWFQGHTTKFKTLITHCGVFNFDSMYATTEEIWFDEWEHGGPPWGKRESYELHSPHRFAKEFKTPMLIIHNDLDFRVPVSEGLQLFTTLQRLGIPSRMVNFPDEGHWVLKPANSAFWHKEVFTWLKKFVPPGGQ